MGKGQDWAAALYFECASKSPEWNFSAEEEEKEEEEEESFELNGAIGEKKEWSRARRRERDHFIAY